MKSGVQSTVAVAFAAGGLATAFALAACCAIPIFLATIGAGANWLVPLVTASQPHASILMAFSLVALVGSVAIVARAPRNCAPGALCARPAFRWTIIAAAIAGAVLLALSQIYA